MEYKNLQYLLESSSRSKALSSLVYQLHIWAQAFVVKDWKIDDKSLWVKCHCCKTFIYAYGMDTVLFVTLTFISILSKSFRLEEIAMPYWSCDRQTYHNCLTEGRVYEWRKRPVPEFFSHKKNNWLTIYIYIYIFILLLPREEYY